MINFNETTSIILQKNMYTSILNKWVINTILLWNQDLLAVNNKPKNYFIITTTSSILIFYHSVTDL